MGIGLGGIGLGGGGGGGTTPGTGTVTPPADIRTNAEDPQRVLRVRRNGWTEDWRIRAALRVLNVQASARVGTANGTMTVEALRAFRAGAAGNAADLALRDRGVGVAEVAAKIRIRTDADAADGVEVTLDRDQAAGADGNGWQVDVQNGPVPVQAVAAHDDIGNIRITAAATGTAANGIAFVLATGAARSVVWDGTNRRITYTADSLDSWGGAVDHFNDETGGVSHPAGMPAVVLSVINQTQHAQPVVAGNGTLAGGVDGVDGIPTGAVLDAAGERIVLTQNTGDTYAVLKGHLDGAGLSVADYGTAPAGLLRPGSYVLAGGVTAVYARPADMTAPNAEVLLWVTGKDQVTGIRLRLDTTPGAAGNAWHARVAAGGGTGVNIDAGNNRVQINVAVLDGTVATVVQRLQAQGLHAEAIGTAAVDADRLANGDFNFAGGVDNVAAILWFNTAASLADVKATIDADGRYAATVDIHTQVGGVTLASFLGTTLDFTGGVDEETLVVTEDTTAQRVTVRYNPAEDTMGDVDDAFTAVGGYTTGYRGGAVAADTPEPATFERNVGAVTTGGTGGTQGAITEPEAEQIVYDETGLHQVYIAAVDNANPAVADFDQASRGPQLLDWTGRKRVAMAYPATLTAALLGLDRRLTPVTEGAQRQLGGVAHDVIVSSRALAAAAGGTLVEPIFPNDRT